MNGGNVSNPISNLFYDLYTDAGRTTKWGTDVGGSVIDQTNLGGATPTIYGRIPSGQTPAAASALGQVHTDVVTVTLTFP